MGRRCSPAWSTSPPSNDGTARTRLLDLVPGRSGRVYADWLQDRGTNWLAHIEVAALDPFRGYKNAIDDHLDDATAVLDAFHVVKLATQAVDEVRRRVQQATLGHRGRKGEPLFGIQTILRCSAANLSDKQKHRLQAAIEAHEAHEEVFIAWQAAQRVRAIYHADTPAAGRAAAQQLLDTLPTCPIPEIARLGRTLKQWREAFLAYFDTGGASNGPHRGDQRADRTPPPHRQRLPQPRQLPTTLPTHRRRPGHLIHPQVRRASKRLRFASRRLRRT